MDFSKFINLVSLGFDRFSHAVFQLVPSFLAQSDCGERQRIVVLEFACSVASAPCRAAMYRVSDNEECSSSDGFGSQESVRSHMRSLRHNMCVVVVSLLRAVSH
jgi:hypothetical protein